MALADLARKDFEMGKMPLEGIKVASLAWIGVGPLSIRYFAHWGATVVRIESHRYIDTMRQTIYPFFL